MNLMSKTKGTSVSTKTKEVIVDRNVDTSKVTHQRKNAITHLKKRTEKNEGSLMFNNGIKGVSRHDIVPKLFQDIKVGVILVFSKHWQITSQVFHVSMQERSNNCLCQ